MTREQALAIADQHLTTLIASGNEQIFAAAGNDQGKIVAAAMRAREELADRLMADAGLASARVDGNA